MKKKIKKFFCCRGKMGDEMVPLPAVRMKKSPPKVAQCKKKDEKRTNFQVTDFSYFYPHTIESA
jgi:hypothetical protein